MPDKPAQPMKTTYNPKPSPKAQKTLDALQSAVTEALDKKRRLGQYAVFWDGKAVILEGEDAPEET